MTTDLKLDGLVMTIGAPGSGKSTWADKNLPDDMLRLERDRFRECLFSSRKGYWESPILASTKAATIDRAMKAAMDAWLPKRWAVTDTNLAAAKALPFVNAATQYGVPVTLVIFERSESFLRNINFARRGEHQVPDEVLDDMIANFHDEHAWWRRDSFRKIWIDQF